MFSRDRLIKAIDNSACLTRRQIDDYLQNKLYPEELYVVEMHLNECPFCNDAIDGYKNVPNANTLLSKISDFGPSATIIEKKEIAPKTNIELVVENPKQQTQQQENPFVSFEQKPKKSRWPLGVAACIAIGLGIWGIAKFGFQNNKNDGLLADNLSNDSLSNAIPKEGSYSTVEDSIMNSKFAFENQAPLSASGKIIVSGDNQTQYDATGDSSASITTEAAATIAAAPAATDKQTSSTFIGPTQPKDDIVKAKPAAAPKPSATQQPAIAAAKTAPSTTNTAAAKTTAASGNKIEAKKAETADKKPVNTQISQAEKDYNKALDLYNKKQYSASIMYFQAAAKVSDFPKRKQAESYIKLAKNEINSSDKKKKAEAKQQSK